MSGAVDIQCFSCGKTLSLLIPVSRREECSSCRADVRVCKNCAHYDPKVYNECRETQADVVKEKDRSTICDYFQPRTSVAGSTSRTDLLAAAEALFKKKE